MFKNRMTPSGSTFRLLALFLLGTTRPLAASAADWQAFDPENPGLQQIQGTWASPATGHIVVIDGGVAAIFHELEDFCIADNGVVPAFALYKLGRSADELLLHHYDYRPRPELLQAPAVFHRIAALPEPCSAAAPNQELPPAEIYQHITRTFDRFYAFFEARGVDWTALKQRYAQRASALNSDEDLYLLLQELLAPFGDGHVNLTWNNQTFNTGRPRLRQRLREAWASSGTDLSEQVFVSTWQKEVQDSVYTVLDAGSLRSGAAGALEWGSIGEAVGYVRINRFSGFTTDTSPRPLQYDALDAALARMREDLSTVRALIVDVSLNGGGSDTAALLVASYFANRESPVLHYEVREAPTQELRISPRGPGENRPILLLTSEVTASAAESFVLMMRAFPHVSQVGSTTRGGLSSLLPKPFPNEFLLTLSYQDVTDAQGISYEGTGIAPAREMELFPDTALTGGLAAALRQLATEIPPQE